MLGGALYLPSNYDALAYRTPRVLNWLAAGHWHWIHTGFQRLNTRGAGIEWITSPIFLFTGTDRLEFLINAFSLLAFPGYVFGVLRRLGTSGRAAWFWMWIFPAGYCYVLQAGSISNDLFGGVLATAAIHYALRARHNGRVGDVWLSFLAAGLMTAAKAFNLLILLPWAVAILPALRLLLPSPAISCAVLLAGAWSSLLPNCYLNWHYCGDWTGEKAEQAMVGNGQPWVRLPANLGLMVFDNFVPPIFPFSKEWERFVHRAVPEGISGRLHSNFEAGAADFVIGEMQMEESAGLGFGASVLLLWLLLRRVLGRKQVERPGFNLLSIEMLVPLGAWFGVFVLAAKLGLACPARYLAPFYVLLAAPLLAGPVAHAMTRERPWRGVVLLTFAVAALLVVLTPPRPLWPARTVLRALGADHAASRLVQRAWRVYAVYGARGDSFQEIRDSLPAGANPLGLITFDDPEAPLWRPYGSRTILHVLPSDPPAETRERGISYVLVSRFAVTNNYRMPFADWMTRNGGETVHSYRLDLRSSRETTEWDLVKLRP